MFVTRRFLSFTLILLFTPLVNLWADSSDGETLYNRTCVACHSIGGGKLVGPDLKGVTAKRSDSWLKEFIKNSAGMIARGDKDAVALFKEYNNMPMPPHPLNDAQLTALVAYLKEKDGAAAPAGTPGTKKIILAKLQPEEVALGQRLFSGKERFEKKAAACITCHNTNVSGMVAGGSLAINLTGAHKKLGDAGLTAIIDSPPFPAMASAYNNKKLTKGEVLALKAFLRDTSEKYADAKPTAYASKLLGFGIIGAILLLVLFSIIWSNRKRGSVNQDIYDRQIKSE